MTEKRFKVTDNTDNPFLCDWSVTDYADGGIVHHPMTSENMANVMCDLLNELHEENERLRKVVDNCQFRTLDLLDYIKEKETVTHQEIKDWWNSKVKEFMTVKINRYEIFNNGAEYKRIYDYLKGEDIVFLSTDNKELNIVLAEVVLKQLNQME